MSEPRSCNSDQLRRPLDAIRSTHDGQLHFCDWLIDLANAQDLGPVAANVEHLLTYLTEDLPLHAKDEEADLFPLLQLRCLSEDRIEAMLERLDREHAAENFLAHHLVAELKVIAGGEQPSNSTRLFNDLRAFAVAQCRHIAWENAVVLPLANKRLSSDDLEEMNRKMSARRRAPQTG